MGHHSLLKPDSLPLRPIPNRPYTIVMDKLKDLAGKVTGKSGGESGGSSSGAGAGGKQEQYIDKGVDMATDKAGYGDKYDDKISVSCSKQRSLSLCLYPLPSPATPTLSPRTLYLRSTTNPPKSALLPSRTSTRAAPSSSCLATSFLSPQQRTSHGRLPPSEIYGRPPQALSWP